MGLTRIEMNDATLDQLRLVLGGSPTLSGLGAAVPDWCGATPLVVNDLLPDGVLRLVDDDDEALVV